MTWKPHVTVAAVIRRKNKFLMVEEKIDGHRVYNQPAGHLEPGETLLQAVIRETLEETAWLFEPQSLIGIYQWLNPHNNKSFMRFSFAGHCLEHDALRPLDTDIERAVWLSIEDIQEREQSLRSPMVLQCIHDYLKGNAYPLTVLKGLS